MGMGFCGFELIFMGIFRIGGIRICGFHVYGCFEIDLVCVDGCVNRLKKMEVESDRDGWDAVKKKKKKMTMKMEVDEGDTCEEMVVNETVGGHSTLEIRVLLRLDR